MNNFGAAIFSLSRQTIIPKAFGTISFFNADKDKKNKTKNRKAIRFGYIAGSLLKTYSNNTQSVFVDMNLSSLSTGIYFIGVSKDNGSISFYINLIVRQLRHERK